MAVIRITRAQQHNAVMRYFFRRYSAAPRVVQALPAAIVAARARLIIAYSQKERIVASVLLNARVAYTSWLCVSILSCVSII